MLMCKLLRARFIRNQLQIQLLKRYNDGIQNPPLLRGRGIFKSDMKNESARGRRSSHAQEESESRSGIIFDYRYSGQIMPIDGAIARDKMDSIIDTKYKP
jgi:hypothetical protein